MKKRTAALWRRWVEETSMHGPAEAKNENSIPGRLFWVTVIIFFFAISALSIHELIDGYMNPGNWAFKTNYQLLPAFPLPVLTLCNHLSLSKHRIALYDKSEERALWKLEAERYGAEHNIFNFNDSLPAYNQSSTNPGLDQHRALAFNCYETFRQLKIANSSFAEDMPLPCPERKVWTRHRLGDGRDACRDMAASWPLKRISSTHVTSGQSQCVQVDLSNRDFDESGVMSRVELQLDTGKQDRVERRRAFASGYLQLQISPTSHLTADGWIDLDDYRIYKIKLKRLLKRLEKSSSYFGFIKSSEPPCRQKKDIRLMTMPSHMYSVENCREDCRRKSFADICSCYTTGEPTEGIPICENYRANHCATWITMQIKKEPIQRHPVYTKSFAFRAECESQCDTPCEEVNYQVTVSSSTLVPITPEKVEYGKERRLSAFVNMRDHCVCNATHPALRNTTYECTLPPDVAAQRSTKVYVLIMPESMLQQVLELGEVTSAMDLLSQIGGTLGLWMGMSVVSIIQAHSPSPPPH